MMTLDCATYLSTIKSISRLYGQTIDEVKKFLINLDLDEYFRINNPDGTGYDVLFMLFENKFGKPKQEIEKVCWFHLTSTTIDTDFKDGLLSLSDSLDSVWDKLEIILHNTSHLQNIMNLRKNGVPSHDFILKTKDENNYGPFAILIRDLAFELGHKKYLMMPEIIEDILEGYKKKFVKDIRDLVGKSLKPCIVKFWSKKRIDEDCIKTAVDYLHTYLRGNNYTLYSNTCYDGYNEKIPFEQIQKIEYLEL